jgi:hypothetical protein
LDRSTKWVLRIKHNRDNKKMEYSVVESKDDCKGSYTSELASYSVTRNGVTVSKPDWMGDDHWFTYVAPRVGKDYMKRNGDDTYLFGHDAVAPTEGVDEREDGCDGGSCAI